MGNKISRMISHITTTAMTSGVLLYQDYVNGLIGDVEYYEAGLCLEYYIKHRAVILYVSGAFDAPQERFGD